eukprot:1160784-Pelagomonas_calceolata.AAC.5
MNAALCRLFVVSIPHKHHAYGTTHPPMFAVGLLCSTDAFSRPPHTMTRHTHFLLCTWCLQPLAGKPRHTTCWGRRLAITRQSSEATNKRGCIEGSKRSKRWLRCLRALGSRAQDEL